MRGDHRRVFLLAAKRPACFELYDAHAICGQPTKVHQRLVHIVRTLKRPPHRESLPRVESRDHSIVLDVELFLRSSPIFTFHDVVGLLPGTLYIALFNQNGLERVASAPNNFPTTFTLFDGENGWERIVIDRYVFYRNGQKMRVFVSQQENRLFGMVDNSICETRLVVFDQCDAILAGNISCGNNDEFLPRNLLSKSDFPDLAAWNLAAHRRTVQHAGQNHVVHIPSLSADFLAPFQAWNGCSDDVIAVHAHPVTAGTPAP